MSDAEEKYSVIYADPPYAFRDKNKNGNRGSCCRYSTMSIDEIKWGMKLKSSRRR